MILISMGRTARHLLFTAAMAAGLLTLTACSGGGSSSTALVESVNISAQEMNVPLNTSTDISATVNLSNNTTNTSTAVTFLINGAACVTQGASCPEGTIVPSAINPQVGVYTAPAKAPGTNNNQLTVTATAPQNPSSSTDTAVVTSNSLTITIGSGLGLAIQPAAQSVPAGSTFQFSATLNSVNDPSAKWSVTPVAGVDVGVIDNTGLYTAPPSPPPGGTVTITAMDPAAPAPANAIATIVFSDASFKGPFAFSYSGGTGANFVAISGSLVTDGMGSIQSGIEDVLSAGTGVHKQVQIISGNYLVRSDGRVNATLTTGVGNTTWEFALVSTQHADMIRFDKNDTASGTIDQQDLNALTNSDTLIQGPIVFGVSGFDLKLNPMAAAGEFTANGVGGIGNANTVLDVNDNGTVTTLDRSLQGAAAMAYSFDAANPGTGRGTLSITSNTTKQLTFAFYIVDSTAAGGVTHLKLVEIDENGFLSGHAYQEFTPANTPPFSGADLAAGNYVFTSVGTSTPAPANPPVSPGPYASGGIFKSDGAANVTGGALDVNIVGSTTLNTALGTCGYSVDAATGRVDLKLLSANGPCPAGPAANVAEFATYQTAQGTAVMLEIDATAVSIGLAHQQSVTAALPTGSFALELATRGVGQGAAVEQDATGQASLTGASLTSGNLDINDSNATFQTDPLSSTGSSITAPDQNGRGTAVLNGTDPIVTFDLDYFIIDNSHALLFGTDKTRVGIGIVSQQF